MLVQKLERALAVDLVVCVEEVDVGAVIRRSLRAVGPIPARERYRATWRAANNGAM